MEKDEKLFEENLNLVYFTIQKYYPYLRDDDDVIQEAAVGLLQACRTYDQNQSKFSTYAVKCILTAIQMHLRTQYRLNKLNPVSIEEIVYQSDSSKELLTVEGFLIDERFQVDDLNFKLDVERILETFSKRNQSIVKQLLEGYTQSQLASQYNCTRANISRIWRKFTSEFSKSLLN